VAWWWWAGAGVLGLVVLALVVWGLIAVFRRAAVPGAPVRPEKIALRELKSLRKRAAAMPAPEFGAAVSDVIRTFLHRRMGLLARFATTEEILGHTRRRDEAPPPPPVQGFAAVLEKCDALKFANAGTAGREELIAEAESALHSVARALQHPPAAPAPPAALPEVPHAPAA
jgi:hypothetical protein